jgi:ABC-type sulfate/molybdate transport systems ATPase subunit
VTHSPAELSGRAETIVSMDAGRITHVGLEEGR